MYIVHVLRTNYKESKMLHELTRPGPQLKGADKLVQRISHEPSTRLKFNVHGKIKSESETHGFQ